MTYEDNEKLERFFRYFITQTSFGYTLCGDKPCSIETYPPMSKLPLLCFIKVLFKFPNYSLLRDGWNIWLKYADRSPNFVFKYNQERGALIIINKRTTRKVIEENIDLFRQYRNSNQSVDEFLNEICGLKYGEYFFKCNVALLGILLGYGRNNSLAFNQKNHFQNLKKFNLYTTSSIFNEIRDPGFMVIENGTNEKENTKIRQVLRKAKKKIKQSFKDEQYFKTFMSLWDSQI